MGRKNRLQRNSKLSEREYLATLVSRVIQNASTETTYAYHKTKVGDAWNIKNRKNLDKLRWAQGTNF